MPDFPKIWFLRHGQTHWNAERRVQGQLESDLTETGRGHAAQQAVLIDQLFANVSPPCLVSPLRRAQQTAEIAMAGRKFTTDPRLAEAQAGVFQGRTMAEIERDYPQIYRAHPYALDLYCAAPEAESFTDFQNRILSVLHSLSEPTVLVAHGLWGQVLRGLICGLSREEMAELPNEQGCIYVLEHGEESVLK